MTDQGLRGISQSFSKERDKLTQFEKNLKSNENDVRSSLHQHENGLTFWKKELELALDKVVEERRKLQESLAYIEHNHNHIIGLLDSVKRCQDFRLYGSAKRVPTDETDKALYKEYQLLLSCSQTCIQLSKEVGELTRGLQTIELDLTQDLQNKISSLETTYKCHSILSNQSAALKPSPNLTAIANVIKDDNFAYSTFLNGNSPVNIRSASDGGNWYDELSRRLQRATDVVAKAASFRNNVKDTCERNSSKISSVWSEVHDKIKMDSMASEAEREKIVGFLSFVSSDLSTTRERISTLRGEIERHTRHLQSALRRVGNFQLKPSTESLTDEPLNEMKKQCESSAKILLSLESSLDECREQENKLIAAEKELRKSLQRTQRISHTHDDQVQGQWRRTAIQSSNNNL